MDLKFGKKRVGHAMLGRLRRLAYSISLIDQLSFDLVSLSSEVEALKKSHEQSRYLVGDVACQMQASLMNIKKLCDVEFKVSSQWGEDGIINWLVSRLPGLRQSFIEFGVESYTEANTRFLLQKHNWRGLIADGSQQHIDEIKTTDLMWRHSLTAVRAFVTPENVNSLFSSNGFHGEIGLLSIDIDGQDYWVWKAVNVVNPQIVICEYNAVFGDLLPIAIPSDSAFERTKAHPSNLYWGCSIKALEILAFERGYHLIGTNSAGCNAFFLRDDMMQQLGDSIADRKPRPSMFRESRDESGALTYLEGSDRLAAIAHLPVVDLRSGANSTLRSLGDLYSPEWQALMALA